MKSVAAKGVLVGVVLAALGLGCLGNIDLGYTCQHPDKGHRDAQGNPDPCHYNDPGTLTAKDDAGDAGGSDTD